MSHAGGAREALGVARHEAAEQGSKLTMPGELRSFAA